MLIQLVQLWLLTWSAMNLNNSISTWNYINLVQNWIFCSFLVPQIRFKLPFCSTYAIDASCISISTSCRSKMNSMTKLFIWNHLRYPTRNKLLILMVQTREETIVLSCRVLFNWSNSYEIWYKFFQFQCDHKFSQVT